MYDTKSPITTIPTRAHIPFSTRLRPTSNNTNLPFSGRNISEPQTTRVNNEQRQSPRSNITLIINPGIKKKKFIKRKKNLNIYFL
jgi:hypothetical protein